MTIEERQQEIIDEFAVYDDWMDKYAYIIEIGNGIAPLNEGKKVDSNLIDGCQSKVWLTVERIDNRLYFSADSDAIITKGIAGILIRVFSDATPNEIIEAKLDFIDEIGLNAHLSPTRSNGLISMIKQIKLYALVLKEQ